MRNLLAFAAALLLTFAGAGWYLGWYTVQSSAAPPGHHAVNIDIDGQKIGQDLHKGSEKLQEALEKKAAEKLQAPADKSQKADTSKPAETTKTDSPKLPAPPVPPLPPVDPR